MAYLSGIQIKKWHGQHFLRDQKVVDHILEAVLLDKTVSVFEIGCGDGFLTRALLQQPLARLWVFEIDAEWAQYVQNIYGHDTRFVMHNEDFLHADLSSMSDYAPWVLLANLPYHITFPILRILCKNMDMLQNGVVMVQEEVAQKIVGTTGRSYGFISLYFQYYFSWKLLAKVSPEAFEPPPKVYSRLLYFKPNTVRIPIVHEAKFWAFIKRCFGQPRRTLANNLKILYNLAQIPSKYHALRAQQLTMTDFLFLWDCLSL